MTIAFPFGNEQTFTLGSLSVTVRQSDREYQASSDGNGYLPILGYDRTPNAEYLARGSYNSYGTTVWDGPSFQIPMLFEWKLQRLTMEKYETFWAMWRIQQRQKLTVTLTDRRLAMAEPTPITRTSAGTVTGSPSIAGMQYYWGVFGIELLLEESEYRRRPKFCTETTFLYDLSFKAREILV